MNRIARRVTDKRVLKLIRQYLVSGIMLKGIVVKSEEGTIQGGPLSPLLSNVVLDELDKELEKRGLKFCRFADDCNIFVGSQKAAERVMRNISQFIEKKLKLTNWRQESLFHKPGLCFDALEEDSATVAKAFNVTSIRLIQALRPIIQKAEKLKKKG